MNDEYEFHDDKFRLNLGCGDKPMDGYTNIDRRNPFREVKIIDLNRLPWPFKDQSILKIHARAIIEHLGKLTKPEIYSEIARIMGHYGTVCIIVPCVTHHNALAPLEHAHAFYFNSFEENYTQPYFTVESIYATLDGGLRIPYVWGLRAACRFFAWLHLVNTIEFNLRRK